MLCHIAPGALAHVPLKPTALCFTASPQPSCACHLPLLTPMPHSPPPSSLSVKGLQATGMSSHQSGLDSVRNLTGNPIAGVDPHELIDTRWVGTRRRRGM